jgi:hypothetical protein
VLLVEDEVEKLGGSINEVADLTGESPWKVKEKLRNGTYKARKSGRRTIVELSSVHEAWKKLPVAKYAPPRTRKSSAA